MIKPHLGPPPGCGILDFVQLEMIGVVPEIAGGEKFMWSTAGKQRFIHRPYPKVTLDEDGEFVSQESYKVTGYHATAEFDMYPHAVQFHSPEPMSICSLESVVSRGQEQILQTAFVIEIFGLSRSEPLAVAWPMFNQDHPLTLQLHNPMERVLPSFSLSFHISATKDFAERWREDGQAEED